MACMHGCFVSSKQRTCLVLLPNFLGSTLLGIQHHLLEPVRCASSRHCDVSAPSVVLVDWGERCESWCFPASNCASKTAQEVPSPSSANDTVTVPSRQDEAQSLIPCSRDLLLGMDKDPDCLSCATTSRHQRARNYFTLLHNTVVSLIEYVEMTQYGLPKISQFCHQAQKSSFTL